MRNLFNISNWPETVIAILVEFQQEGYLVYAGKIKKNRFKVGVAKEFLEFESLEKVIKKFGLNLSYAINFTGRGVLTKQFSNESFTIDKVIHGQDPKGFMFNKLVSDKYTFVSFARRNQIMGVLEVFEKRNIMLIDYSLGELSIGSIPICEDIKIEYNNKLYEIKGNNLKSIQNTDHQTTDFLNSKDIQIEKKYLSVIGQIHKLYESKIEKSNIDWVDKKRLKENNERKIFHYAGAVIISLFLILLVSNYFYLESINSKVVEKNSLLQEYSSAVQEVSVLRKEKKRKRLVLNSSGILNSHYLSFYVNDIVKSIPPDTKLSSINVFPVESVKESKKLIFSDRVIIVEGTTKSSTYVNTWINKISKLDWIQKVELVDYSTNYENVGEFNIQLQVKFE